MPVIPNSQVHQRRRHFLKDVGIRKGALTATFRNGYSTDSRDAATFFQLMDERGKTLEQIQETIHIGRQCDPFKDWPEIQRIADSFEGE